MGVTAIAWQNLDLALMPIIVIGLLWVFEPYLAPAARWVLNRSRAVRDALAWQTIRRRSAALRSSHTASAHGEPPRHTLPGRFRGDPAPFDWRTSCPELDSREWPAVVGSGRGELL